MSVMSNSDQPHGDNDFSQSATLLQSAAPILKIVSLAAIAFAFLYVIWGLYLAGQPIFAVVTFAVGISIVVLFGWKRFYTWRFVFPGVAAISIFIVLPVFYTSGIGFTNYSATNILPFERVQQLHLDKMVKDPTSARPFSSLKICACTSQRMKAEVHFQPHPSHRRWMVNLSPRRSMATNLRS